MLYIQLLPAFSQPPILLSKGSTMKRILLAMTCAFGLAGCGNEPDNSSTTPMTPPPAPRAQAVTPAPPPAPDNSGVNTRDRDTNARTAGVQGQTKTDVDVTADIRQRIMAASLSVNAQNCKIVTQSGRVTLRGPVKDQTERDAIGTMAIDVAGAANVDNQLEIPAAP